MTIPKTSASADRSEDRNERESRMTIWHTPEREQLRKTVRAFAGKAERFTRDLIEGRSVRLEYDWQRLDKYGRTLAYVTREEDGLDLNAEILRQGYGFPYLYFPFRRSGEFRALGAEARAAKRGLWGADSTSSPRMADSSR